MLGGRVSILTTWGCWSRSSAASSMVATRSSAGMKADRAFMRVVFPDPVPPETTMFTRARVQAERKSTISWVIAFFSTRSLNCRGVLLDRRIERSVPSSARGGITAFTRDPSGRRASQRGEVSSIRLPTRDTIRRTISMRCFSSWKTTSERVNRPRRST